MLHLLHMQTNINDDTAGLSPTPCLDLKPLFIPILIFRSLRQHQHQHQQKEKQEKGQGRQRRHPVPRRAGTRRPRGPGNVPGLRRAHGAGPGVDGVRGDALRVHGGAVALAVRTGAAAGGGRVGPGDGPRGRVGSAGPETRPGKTFGCSYGYWYDGDGDGGKEHARAGAVQGGRLAGGAAARAGAGGRLRGGAAGVEGARRRHGAAGGDEDGDQGGEGGAGEERAAHGVRVLPGRGGDGEPDALEREGRGGGSRGVGGGGEVPRG